MKQATATTTMTPDERFHDIMDRGMKLGIPMTKDDEIFVVEYLEDQIRSNRRMIARLNGIAIVIFVVIGALLWVGAQT